MIETFENFCTGKTNETYVRYCFNKRDQEQGENIDTYVSHLRTLVKKCNYDTLEESLIRDRMVIGIRENTTRKKLLQDSKLTLTSCIDICRANEKNYDANEGYFTGRSSTNKTEGETEENIFVETTTTT